MLLFDVYHEMRLTWNNFSPRTARAYFGVLANPLTAGAAITELSSCGTVSAIVETRSFDGNGYPMSAPEDEDEKPDG